MKKQSYEVKKMNQFSNQKTDDVTKMEAEAKFKIITVEDEEEVYLLQD